MKNNNNKKTGISAGKMLAIGAGVAALATASYYLFGPEAKKNQKKVKGWMIKMKGDIVDKIEDAKEMSESVYHQIVDTVGSKYLKNKKASQEDVLEYIATLKKHWKGIAKTTAPQKKSKTKKVASQK